MACGFTATLVALAMILQVSAQDNYGRSGSKNYRDFLQYVADKEYIQQIHSLIDAYRDEIDDRMGFKTNSLLIDTKYRPWKRNADLINSLLALPKGMNDAGR